MSDKVIFILFKITFLFFQLSKSKVRKFPYELERHGTKYRCFFNLHSFVKRKLWRNFVTTDGNVVAITTSSSTLFEYGRGTSDSPNTSIIYLHYCLVFVQLYLMSGFCLISIVCPSKLVLSHLSFHTWKLNSLPSIHSMQAGTSTSLQTDKKNTRE